MKHYKLQNHRLSHYFTQAHNYMYVLFVMRFINQLPLVHMHVATPTAGFQISRKWKLYWNQTLGNGICTRRLMRQRMRVLFAIKLYAVYVILATLKVLKLQLLALPCSIFIASALACVTAIRTLGKLFNQSFHNFISILE